MKKFIFILSLSLFFMSQVHSQIQLPENCGEGTPSCDFDAIDGEMFTNPIYTGNTGGDVCNGGAIHNAGWYGFVAGNTDMTIDITVAPNSCVLPPNPPCNNLGVQIAVWEGCPDSGGSCIAGDADCVPDGGSVSFDATGLQIGGVYYILVDGCCGTTCTSVVDISVTNWEFEIPDANEIEITSADQRSCDDLFGDHIYCPGQEVFIAAEGNNGVNDLNDVGAEWEWTITALSGPGTAGDVEWDTPAGGGTGSPVEYGDLVAGVPGGNTVTMIFNEAGVYEVCVTSINTICDPWDGGQACQEITIINPEEQFFGEFTVCIYEHQINGEEFVPPIFEDPSGMQWEWADGSQGISFGDVNNGIAEAFVGDPDCCTFRQWAIINHVGTIEPEDIEIPLFACQLPYEWEDLIIDEFDAFDGFFHILENGSLEEGFNIEDEENCDSLVNIFAIEIEVGDSLIIGDCGPTGIEVEPDIFSLNNNFDFDLSSPQGIWRDTFPPFNIVATTWEATLPPGGCYTFEYSGFVEDVLTGDDVLCSGSINYKIPDGGTGANPTVIPYDNPICEDEMSGIDLGVNPDPNATSYQWIIPGSYTANSGTSAPTVNVTMNNYVATDTIVLRVGSECGSLDIPFPLELSELPQISVDVPSTGCENEEITFTYTGMTAGVTLNWDVSPGTIVTGTASDATIGVSYPSGGVQTYNLDIVNANNCMDSYADDIDIGAGLPDPVVMCDPNQTSSNQVGFMWADVPGATGYTVNVLSPAGLMGTLNGTSYVVDGLSAGDVIEIEVIVDGSACGSPSDTETCSASSCALPSPDLGNFEDFSLCNGDMNMPVQFTAQAPAGFTGTYSGSGVSASGLFDPDDPSLVIGANTLTFSYVDDNDPNCADARSITVTIGETPDPTFTIDQTTICQNEPVTVTGPSSGNPLYTTSGTQNGNEFTFDTPGSNTISVFVEDPASSCSDELTLTFDVLPALEPLTVNCNEQTESITFTWNEIAGAQEYKVNFVDRDGNSSDFTLTPTETTYEATGLSPGDVVSITVVAIHPDGCNSVMDAQTCEAKNCEVVDITMTSATGDTDFCTNETPSAVNIDIVVNGTAPAAGAGTFSGQGVTQSGDDAVFDPAGLPAGVYTVDYLYVNPVDNCSFDASLDFTIIEVPTPSITPDATVICVGDVLTFDHSGVENGQTWSIDPNNPDVEDNLTMNQYEMAWSNPGIYTISLAYTEAGCNPNETMPVTIEVRDSLTTPQISCANVGPDFIEWSWSQVGTNVEYEILIDNVPIETTMDNTYRVDGLNQGDERTITVMVRDDICGDKMASLMCTANFCVPPAWDVQVDSEYCYADGDPAIELLVNATSNVDPTISGQAEWQSSEVVNNMFTPEPGTNTYTFVARFVEGSCTLDTPITFTVYDVPQFTMTQPDPICIGGSVTLDYDYVGPGNEITIWDFDGGNGAGSGLGPQEVSYDQDGQFNVTLQINNNGCLSDPQNVLVVVEPELEAPVISCDGATITTIDISWNMVDCASEYIVYVDGTEFARTMSTSQTIDGLTSEQSVELTVEAISECACGNSVSAPESCETMPCPMETFTFSFDNSQSICLDNTVAPFQITATPDMVGGNGVGVWDVTPFMDTDGNIDPSLASAGTFDLNYTYTLDVCNFSTSTSITFVEAPSINVIDVVDPACPEDSEGVIAVEGVGGTPDYMYSLDGGAFQADGTFTGISVGLHSVTVMDANGCLSEPAERTINAPSQPSASVSGPGVIILENDGTYTLNLDGIDVSQIDNIEWFNNGASVCGPSPTCLEYTYAGALTDAVIYAEITYNGGCSFLTPDFAVDVKQIQAVYVPNTFSTQLNDINNRWTMFIKGDEVFPQDMQVFNRWGNLVFEIDWNFAEGNLPPRELDLWDGFYGLAPESSPIVSEVYVYTINVEIEGIPRNISGSITVIR